LTEERLSIVHLGPGAIFQKLLKISMGETDKDQISSQDQEELKDALITLMNSSIKQDPIAPLETSDNTLARNYDRSGVCSPQLFFYTELSTYEQALSRAFNMYHSPSDYEKLQAIVHFPETRLISLHRITLKQDNSYKTALDGICNKALAQAIKIASSEVNENSPLPDLQYNNTEEESAELLSSSPKKKEGFSKRRGYRCAECIRKHSKCKHDLFSINDDKNAQSPAQTQTCEVKNTSPMLKRKRKSLDPIANEEDYDNKEADAMKTNPKGKQQTSRRERAVRKKVRYEEPPDFELSDEEFSPSSPPTLAIKKLDTPREKGTACNSCRKLKVRCNGTHRYCHYKGSNKLKKNSENG